MNKVNFGKIVSSIDSPFLLKMQKDSFAGFLQPNVAPEKRKLQGLEGVFRDIFPLKNFDESLVLEYISYSFGEPKYSVDESIARDATYALPLKVKLRLMHKKEDGK
jgi:DNA-directed RNA polymerase subunit beta